ncbi:pimeloyl-[acyl-carrier protein] methyl ester esterase [Idiomarina sp. X4]|nr:pimeloyl-[acyl-carrier protein] methyl ester esterase [Idiomarina sp. X4]
MSLSIQCHGAGTPLVVIHGWGMNSNIWQPIIPSLSEKYTVYCVDLPGFGDSSWSFEASVSLDDLVDALAPALPERFHVMGWSLGGLVATQFTLKHPDRVLSLTTVASSPHFVESDSWPGIKPRVLEQFQQQLDSDFRKTIERFLAIQAMGSSDAKAQIKLVRELIFSKPTPDQKVLKETLKLLQECDLREQLVNVEVPFLRLYGRLDSLVPERAITKIDELAPQSKSVTFNKSSHAPFLSEPDDFCRVLSEFSQN